MLFCSFLLAGCAGVPTYTSQDLAILPCETDVPRFFQPYEFNVDGTPLFADQQAAVERRVREQQPRDIVVFIHGWNKTAYVAEREYQDFLCRFHARLREAEGAAAIEPDRLLIIGMFWRSTLGANGPDPMLAKWITYFPIRLRADVMARTGFTELMQALTVVLGERRDKAAPKLHLVGHSFGGRIIVNGMRNFIRLGTPAHDLLRRVDRLNMVLLTPPSVPRISNRSRRWRCARRLMLGSAASCSRPSRGRRARSRRRRRRGSMRATRSTCIRDTIWRTAGCSRSRRW